MYWLERDQSYFLFATTQEQVDYLRFPIGNLRKSEVRKLAKEMGLTVAQKHDSQDICFIPEEHYANVVARLKPEASHPGDIVHIDDGRVLGCHKGIVNFTVGQRRGIGVAIGEALYVVYLDVKNARVIVGPREALKTRKIYLRDTNWLGDEDLIAYPPSSGIEVSAKVRSTQEPIPAILYCDKRRFHVEFLNEESGVALGQACVFYSDQSHAARILGGGFISHSEHTPDVEMLLNRLLM